MRKSFAWERKVNEKGIRIWNLHGNGDFTDGLSSMAQEGILWVDKFSDGKR